MRTLLSPAVPLANEATEPSEGAFIVRLRRAEPRAFEELVLAHQDRVFRFCLRTLGDREEAHDVVQEIFMAVHRHLREFRGESKLSTWILRVAHNQCLNRLKYLRRRGREHSESFDGMTDSALEKIESMEGAPERPDDLLLARREQERIHAAIAQLDDLQRPLVVLRDVEGFSYEEVSAITGLAVGTVKSRLHRAREKLMALLASPGQE